MSNCASALWSNPTFQGDLNKQLNLGRSRQFDSKRVIYYTGHETIIPSGRRAGLPRWREELFAFMHHNPQRPGAYFRIPSAQIMEIGVEFESCPRFILSAFLLRVAA